MDIAQGNFLFAEGAIGPGVGNFIQADPAYSMLGGTDQVWESIFGIFASANSTLPTVFDLDLDITLLHQSKHNSTIYSDTH